MFFTCLSTNHVILRMRYGDEKTDHHQHQFYKTMFIRGKCLNSMFCMICGQPETWYNRWLDVRSILVELHISMVLPGLLHFLLVVFERNLKINAGKVVVGHQVLGICPWTIWTRRSRFPLKQDMVIWTIYFNY